MYQYIPVLTPTDQCEFVWLPSSRWQRWRDDLQRWHVSGLSRLGVGILKRAESGRSGSGGFLVSQFFDVFFGRILFIIIARSENELAKARTLVRFNT